MALFFDLASVSPPPKQLIVVSFPKLLCSEESYSKLPPKKPKSRELVKMELSSSLAIRHGLVETKGGVTKTV